MKTNCKLIVFLSISILGLFSQSAIAEERITGIERGVEIADQGSKVLLGSIVAVSSELAFVPCAGLYALKVPQKNSPVDRLCVSAANGMVAGLRMADSGLYHGKNLIENGTYFDNRPFFDDPKWEDDKWVMVPKATGGK